MQFTLDILVQEVARILAPNAPSLYLHGSATADDFHPGWSDLDIVCFTETPLADEQAAELMMLRQTLAEKHGAHHFRALEGGFLPLDAFLSGEDCVCAYWGTSGQKIAKNFRLDSFSRITLIDTGRLLYGPDVRGRIPRPGADDLRADVAAHLATIREVSPLTGRSLYSAGWLFDTARGIYTLRTGGVIPKTRAGEWALENNLCPDPDDLRRALDLRRNPALFADESVLVWLENLDSAVQRFADVLARELA